MHRFCSLIALLLFMLNEPLNAATLWARGVTAESGWQDYNKSWIRGKDGDDLLCWAAVCSNLLTWWQQQNAALVPQGTPTGEAVWATYKSSFENEGGDPDQGLRWWFSGVYDRQNPGGGMSCATLQDSAMGGYYREQGPAPEQLLYNGRWAEVTAEKLTEVLLRGFRRGDAFWVGVSLRKPDGSHFMHSINVWGIDEEDGRVLAVYMCDSDDRQTMLHRIPVVELDGRLYLDCTGHPLYGRIGRVVIDTYTGLRCCVAE